MNKIPQHFPFTTSRLNISTLHCKILSFPTVTDPLNLRLKTNTIKALNHKISQLLIELFIVDLVWVLSSGSTFCFFPNEIHMRNSYAEAKKCYEISLMKKRYQEWIEEFAMCFKSMMWKTKGEKERTVMYCIKNLLKVGKLKRNPSEM